ncbi:YczE/YyaS/YitT family protein [Lacticigenium naphthae]|uniref:YczE/YyaS/YitT family protein n=1 Tax=Lacticigenium naphthae TaxID=515351 RepID=UPI000417F762|nr:hypothetical protein [Lacticigenium naphthae]
MNQLKKIVIMLGSMVLVAFGASLTLKAAIGVGAWDALIQSLSFLSDVKVGTIGMILNISCIVGQLILLKKDFHFRQFLQVPISIILGVLINFFYYTLFANLVFDQYIVTLIVYISALVIVSFSVGMVVVLDVISFPLEGFCMAIAKNTKYKFAFVRQMADVLSLVLAVTLTLLFTLPLTVREGTFIGMVIFAPMMGFFMSKIQPFIENHIIDVPVNNTEQIKTN